MKIKTASYFSASVILVLAFFVFTVAFFGFLPQARAESSVGANQRLVTIYDRGEERSVITSKTTLRAVFEEIGLAIDANDIVEPGLDEELVGKDYRVNIYRARPIVIEDGLQQIKVMSAYQTPDQIAKQAGIHLQDEDIAELTQSDDLLTDGASLRLVIDRAIPVKLTLYGTTETVYTQATTVSELLEQKNITLAANDTLSISEDEPIVANMKIEIWRNGKQTITKEESIDFPVEQIQDADREVGYRQVKTAGTKGKKMVTYEIVMKNGKQKSKRVIQTVIITKAKKQVEIIGAKRKTGTPAENRQYARSIMASYGFGESQWPCLDSLWAHESGWDQYKSNYGGSGAYGIPQALPGSKMGPGWQDDAGVQIRWGLGYIKGRYGTPCAAYGHLQTANWY